MANRSSLRCVHLSSEHPADDVRILVKECESLAEAGFDVHLIAQPSRSGKPAEALSDTVRVHTLESPSGGGANILRRVREVRQRALVLDADVYHFHDPELLSLGIELKVRGKRVVYDVHEDYRKQFLNKRWMRLWKRWVAVGVIAGLEVPARPIFDAFVAATPDMARHYPSRKTTVVFNFPRLREFPTPGGETHGKRPPVVIYVGGLYLERGVSEMIKAVQRVARRREAKLLLGGVAVNKETEQVLEQARRLPMVEDRGWLDRSEVLKALNTSRAGIVVLRPERRFMTNYPVKMFEYMATGLPVIASDFPLWREIIEKARCGLLVDPMDPEAIASAIEWILDNPQEAEAMGRRGRAAVEETYNWEEEAKKLVELYDQLSSRTRSNIS